MEGVGDVQAAALHPGGGKLIRNRQHFILRAGDDHTLGAVDRRNRDDLAVGFNRFADEFLAGG